MPASARPSFRFRPAFVAGAAFAAALAIVAAPPAGAQEGRPDRIEPVTDAELANPSADEWLMWRRTLDGWGYSPSTRSTGATSATFAWCGAAPWRARVGSRGRRWSGAG